jgi:hypothetical protein
MRCTQNLWFLLLIAGYKYHIRRLIYIMLHFPPLRLPYHCNCIFIPYKCNGGTANSAAWTTWDLLRSGTSCNTIIAMISKVADHKSEHRGSIRERNRIPLFVIISKPDPRFAQYPNHWLWIVDTPEENDRNLIVTTFLSFGFRLKIIRRVLSFSFMPPWRGVYAQRQAIFWKKKCGRKLLW